MEASVTKLAVAAIKGTRLREVDAIDLVSYGAVGDRQFFVIDERGRMLNGKQLGLLQRVVAAFDPGTRVLAVEFPDGSSVSGIVDGGEPVLARFYSRELGGTLVEGAWSAALSAHAGQPLRLVETESAVDRGEKGAASLISRASLERLAGEAAIDEVDARRFRMLIEVDGLAPHAEDGWIGSRFRIGHSVIQFEGNIGRCLVTSRDPDSGEVDLPTLDLLRGYRAELETTEPLPFGIYGRVLVPGAVAVGDLIEEIT
jgi:uncharacterized protein YcbX